MAKILEHMPIGNCGENSVIRRLNFTGYNLVIVQNNPDSEMVIVSGLFWNGEYGTFPLCKSESVEVVVYVL